MNEVRHHRQVAEIGLLVDADDKSAKRSRACVLEPSTPSLHHLLHGDCSPSLLCPPPIKQECCCPPHVSKGVKDLFSLLAEDREPLP